MADPIPELIKSYQMQLSRVGSSIEEERSAKRRHEVAERELDKARTALRAMHKELVPLLDGEAARLLGDGHEEP